MEPSLSEAPHPPSSSPTRGRPSLSKETLEGVRRREQDALGELFEAYADNLFSLAYRLLGDRTAAEDVTQNVFLKVHRAAHQLDPDRDPGPWLTTITHNLCREHWRSWSYKLGRRSRSFEDAPDVAGALRDDGKDPEAEVLSTERGERLQRAILRLPESMRTVVLLHDYRDFTHEEIARIVDASPAAVRKRYSRGLALLRDLLQDESV
jgi:RNA polymerase sigma-70 factor (ECF subfamily)